MRGQLDMDQYEDDSLSLTASDFELLNNEDFFDKMSDMFPSCRASIDFKTAVGRASRGHTDDTKS